MDVFKTLLIDTPGTTGASVAITGGSINGTNIGATTAGTGAFTTLTASGATTLTATTASTSSTTGALVVSGGVGVAGAGYFAGNLVGVSVNNAYFSSSAAGSNSVLILNSNTQGNFRYIQFSYGAASTQLWRIGYQGSTTDTQLNFESGSGTVLQVTAAGALSVNSVLTASSGVATPAGGSTSARVLLGTTAGFGIYYGSGAPTVSAAQGSIYIRSDGSSTSTRLYVNTNGSTTWTNFTSAA